MKKLLSILLSLVLAASAVSATLATASAQEIDPQKELLATALSLGFIGSEDGDSDLIVDDSDFGVSDIDTFAIFVQGASAFLQDGTDKGFITDDSAAKVQKYVDEASALLDNESATDEEYTFAMYNLEMSFAVDLEIIYNEALVQYAIDVAEQMKDMLILIGAGEDMQAIADELDIFIENAKSLIADGDISEESVTALIEEFIMSLIDQGSSDNPADSLSFAIDTAVEDYIESGIYTEEDLAALVEAVENARLVLADENAETEDYIEAEFALWQEMTNIDDFYTTAEQDLTDYIYYANEFYVNSGDYTEEQLADLLLAIENAEAVLDDENATDEDYELAYSEIDDAIWSLDNMLDEPSPKDDLFNQIAENVTYITSGGGPNDDKETLSVKRDNVISAEAIYLAPASTAEHYAAAAEILYLDIEYDYPDDFEYGDLNGDGAININDATLVQKFAAEIETGEIIIEAGDVNGDGVVNVKDATLIQKYVAEIIYEFPVSEAVG